ncbi:MAG: HEPN domain-containing protein, partial [Oscillospiraceae bacterium]|nr:HEPN domain-containing protein [Oscillospiraceae bacterium]
MSETLLDKAIQNYDIANLICSSSFADESHLNYAAYHLQQAVETAIKFILEENGCEYSRTHNIEQLIHEAESNEINTFTDGYIKSHAEMFSIWETNTRYVMNYKAEISKISDALGGVNRYLRTVEQ